ncbi:hypothetical protein AB5I41_22570 [Sphingomonas sp. MMS24-JH45]
MRSMVEGELREAQRSRPAPSTTPLRVAVPLPFRGGSHRPPYPPNASRRSRRGATSLPR